LLKIILIKVKLGMHQFYSKKKQFFEKGYFCRVAIVMTETLGSTK
jgi:hypothetical protein